MEIPVIDLGELNGEKREEKMVALHEACKKWGFFWVENHGVDNSLMEEVKKHVNLHYEDYMVKSFYNLDMVKGLESCTSAALDGDWESSFFIWHQPNSDIDGIPNLKQEFCETMKGYIQQVIKLAETLAELMSENLGLDRGYLTNAFSEPCVGTKIAKYPKCPKPELVMGLRAHTDAGGIILLLQDDTISGLEFFKEGEWVPIPPSRNGRIFVNLGDQLEVVTNGTYKSILHRVVAEKDRSRLSIATFYNPGSNAIISPARKLMYPSHYRFQDYLNYYVTTKFSDKVTRFQTINEMSTGVPAIADIKSSH